MDAFTFILVLTGIFCTTILLILWYVYQFLRRAMIFMKARDVYQAEAMALEDERDESMEVVETHEDPEDTMRRKQKQTYGMK